MRGGRLARLIPAALAALAGLAPPAGAGGTYGVVIENDEFNGGDDRHYTSGERLYWTSPADRIPDWLSGIARVLPVWSAEGGNRVSLSLGQSVFTPADITRDPPDPDDRPYAGWLYGSIGVSAARPDSLETLELTLGMVGPAALAEPVQTIAHRITGATHPRGWEHQLDNEPGLILSYERKWRLPAELTPGLELDALPSAAASLGNVLTEAALGGMLRIGQGLAADYGPPRVRPGLCGSDFAARPAGGFGWYVFAGAEGRAVLHNLFLDGNSFRHGPSVDRKPFVADLQAGAALLIGDFRLTYTHVYRSREFDGQSKPDWFGSLSLSVTF